MERKKITIELSVLTSRMSNRDIETDVDRLTRNLQGLESGQTTIDQVEVKEIV